MCQGNFTAMGRLCIEIILILKLLEPKIMVLCHFLFSFHTVVRCWTTFSTRDRQFVLFLLLTSSLAWILHGNVGFDRAEITELRNLLQNESSMRKAAEEEIANLKSQLHQFTNPEVLVT